MAIQSEQSLPTVKPELLEVAEAARILGVSSSTVYELAKNRRIAHRRVGVGRGRIFFTEQDILDYLESCKVERDSLPGAAKFTHRRPS